MIILYSIQVTHRVNYNQLKVLYKDSLKDNKNKL